MRVSTLTAFILLAWPLVEALKFNVVAKTKLSVITGLNQRLAADPSFLKKSVTEVVIAAGTQLSAEWNRRGASILPELDFVVAGVLTAVFGKYYAMWCVAPTSANDDSEKEISQQETFAGVSIPTNAFQRTLLDGKTIPSISQRVLSIIAPVPSLFKAGTCASFFAYGLTALLISLRAIFLPEFVAVTSNVNIIYASIYTGVFMAIVSNLRYQILQGIIEPYFIDKVRRYPLVHSALTFSVRTANGFLGSLLGIMGMQKLGLQKLK